MICLTCRGEGELELLYRNYCVRLQHSLFLGCLGVAAAFACLLLTALIVYGQVTSNLQIATGRTLPELFLVFNHTGIK